MLRLRVSLLLLLTVTQIPCLQRTYKYCSFFNMLSAKREACFVFASAKCYDPPYSPPSPPPPPRPPLLLHIHFTSCFFQVPQEPFLLLLPAGAKCYGYTPHPVLYVLCLPSSGNTFYTLCHFGHDEIKTRSTTPHPQPLLPLSPSPSLLPIIPPPRIKNFFFF